MVAYDSGYQSGYEIGELEGSIKAKLNLQPEIIEVPSYPAENEAIEMFIEGILGNVKTADFTVSLDENGRVDGELRITFGNKEIRDDY